tara:strand:- start:557 stop:1450 length:894 start_codon:yes stop_codon:yes gene_type:complete
MKFILFLMLLLSSLQSNQSQPGLSVWFSANDLSLAGGGKLLFNPNGRNVDLNVISKGKLFSTSFIFYPAGIQAQSASMSLSKNNKSIITSINHVSYGTFKGYDENAVAIGNYTSSDTWLRFGYNEESKALPFNYGISNQFYISKLEDIISTSIYSSFGIVWTIKKYNLDIAWTVNDILLFYNRSISNINSTDFLFGVCKDLVHLPLKLSIDSRLSKSLVPKDYFLSGTFYISENISLNLGTSTRKYSQNTEQNLSQTIFGSSGLGVFFKNKELVIGYGLYFYGTGGFSSGLDMSINF